MGIMYGCRKKEIDGNTENEIDDNGDILQNSLLNYEELRMKIKRESQKVHNRFKENIVCK
jgi:hypothetical protein